MEHHEREARLKLIAKLIRVRCYIKDMKNELMLQGPLKRLQVAFMDMMRLRDVIKNLEDMESTRSEEGPQEQYKRYTYIYLKNHLIEKIETAITALEAQTNLLSTRSGVLAILDDLDRATLIFRTKAMNYVVVLPEKAAAESGDQEIHIEKTCAETIAEKWAADIDKKEADSIEKRHAATLEEKQADNIDDKQTDTIEENQSDNIDDKQEDTIEVEVQTDTIEVEVQTDTIEVEVQTDTIGVEKEQVGN